MSRIKKQQSEQPKNGKDEMLDLKLFIERKKIQNEALKKIIEKLNTSVEDKVDT